MAHLIKKGIQFKNFSCACHATDIIFQQENCPSGTLLEGELYLSGKHKSCGYNTEVCVAPTGQEINVTDHKPDSISDLVIFQHIIDFQNQALNKYGEDKDIADTTFVSAKFPENWIILMDKG